MKTERKRDMHMALGLCGLVCPSWEFPLLALHGRFECSCKKCVEMCENCMERLRQMCGHVWIYGEMCSKAVEKCGTFLTHVPFTFRHPMSIARASYYQHRKCRYCWRHYLGHTRAMLELRRKGLQHKRFSRQEGPGKWFRADIRDIRCTRLQMELRVFCVSAGILDVRRFDSRTNSSVSKIQMQNELSQDEFGWWTTFES